MTILLDSSAFVIGAGCSLAASSVLISRLVRVGERLGMTEALLGLVVALAADTPEITVAVTATTHRQGAVGVGVVLGSNVFNLAALLGLGAIVAGTVRLQRRAILFEGVVALWVALVALLVLARWLEPAVALGVVAVVFVPAVALAAMPHGQRQPAARAGPPRRFGRFDRPLGWLHHAAEDVELEHTDPVPPSKATRRDLVEGGAALLIVLAASVVMERTASAVGAHFSVPRLVLGGTVLAAVTSIPNAVAAVHLARSGRGAALLSEALNSNTINLVAGLLIPAAVLGIGMATNEEALIAGWFVLSTLGCLALAHVRRGLRRSMGWGIIASYGAFVALLVATTRG